MEIAKTNMRKSAELLRIVREGSQNELSFLPFKGPILAYQFYNDITMRQFGDLDLYISRDNVIPAAALLQKLGYTTYGHEKLLTQSAWLKAAKDMVFVHEPTKIVIELHWRLYHRAFAKTKEIDLTRDTEEIIFQGQKVSTLNKEFLLAYLCGHGSRHLWERLFWIVDIDRLIRNASPDWERTLYYAHKFSSYKMLLLGLSISKELFDTPLPPHIEQKLQIQSVRKLKYRILTYLFTERPPGVFERKRLHATMQDNSILAFRFWLHTLFEKKYTAILEENDNDTLSALPTLVDFRRPWHLLKKHIKNF
jgi:hypothetical protein